MDYNYLYKKFKRYMEKAGIENITLHDLRKTFGSLLIAQKVDIYRVSKLLRHSSVTVTESHYVDILDRDLEETVKKLDCLFWSKPIASMQRPPRQWSGLFLFHMRPFQGANLWLFPQRLPTEIQV